MCAWAYRDHQDPSSHCRPSHVVRNGCFPHLCFLAHKITAVNAGMDGITWLYWAILMMSRIVMACACLVLHLNRKMNCMISGGIFYLPLIPQGHRFGPNVWGDSLPLDYSWNFTLQETWTSTTSQYWGCCKAKLTQSLRWTTNGHFSYASEMFR